MQKEQREKQEKEDRMREVMMPNYAPKKDDVQNMTQSDIALNVSKGESSEQNHPVDNRESLYNVTSTASNPSQNSGFQFNPDDY